MRFLSKIIIYAATSFLVSIFMMVVTVSVVTNKFPPDLKKIMASYQSLRQMILTSSAMIENKSVNPSQKQNLQSQQASGVDADTDQLVKLNQQRAKMGAGLIGNDDGVTGKQGNSLWQRESVESDSNNELSSIKKSFSELQSQLFRLQQRVAELESEVSQFGIEAKKGKTR
jgi:3-polyprenyl-4-hydroxybenzoate decarboxylase